MNFLWPQYLWIMLAVPLLPALYAWLLHRRGKPALRYSNLDVVREASSGRHWRRHVPPALLLIACSLLLFAAARPLAKLTLPWARSSIMLAMDVSLSMRVSDVKPTRLVAAQEAAKLFLRDLPKNIDVGLVTFAGTAQVAQAATLDRASLVSAIDAFQMQYGTAIGNAIVVCLSELFPDHGINLGDMTFGPRQKVRARDDKEAAQHKPITPVAPGSYSSAATLLLSDGRRSRRAHPRGGPRHRRRRRRRFRRPGHLHAARRADAARGGTNDRWRVPPCRHRGGAAQRLPGPRLAPAGRNPRNRDHRAAGGGCGDPGAGGGVPVDALVRAPQVTAAR